MKRFYFIIILLSTAQLVNAQDAIVPRDTALIELTSDQVNQIFNKMLGAWDVKARAWSVKSNKYKDLTGSATFDKQFNQRYIHEIFTLNWFGTKLYGEGFLKYSSVHQRFDLVQIDDFSSSPLKLIGTWDPAKKILSFRPVFNHSQWDEKEPLKLRWDYYMYEDGSFKKEIWEPIKNGEYILTSEYHYFKRS